jgi:hypothetical protein
MPEYGMMGRAENRRIGGIVRFGVVVVKGWGRKPRVMVGGSSAGAVLIRERRLLFRVSEPGVESGIVHRVKVIVTVILAFANSVSEGDWWRWWW